MVQALPNHLFTVAVQSGPRSSATNPGPFEQVGPGHEIKTGRLPRPIAVGVNYGDGTGRTAIAGRSATRAGFIVDGSSRSLGIYCSVAWV